MTRRRSAPRSLAGALGALSVQVAPQTLLADAQRVWPGVVGPAIAAAAQLTAERSGVLTVSCAASVWAQELDLLAPQIISRLNASLGPVPRVRKLRCVAVGHGR
ncbi:MAG: DUF721 domain-containing protein [Solirubrobacterales bacterium]|nr:DUF721 domain-containing protein [Solirubrobacterales bacterium]